MKFLRLALIPLVIFAAALGGDDAAATSTDEPRAPRVAVLQFGDTETGRRAARIVAAHLSKGGGVEIVAESQARAAARGLGYAGSLNMSLEEARDLGSAIGCDFFITGDAQVVRRSSSVAPVYHEAYASVFVVSTRTGRLVAWDRRRAEGSTPAEAERLLAAALDNHAHAYAHAISRTFADEWRLRERELSEAPPFEDAPEEGSPGAKDFRAPHPYRRLRPEYPETASGAEAEATVDASVEIDEEGKVSRVEIMRWAGFGLDDSVLATVRRIIFRPATRAGRPVPVRVLLRYNFRRPARAGEEAKETKEGEMKLGPLFKAIMRPEP